MDGDTIHVDVEGFPAIIGENTGVRLDGWDTPELRDKRPPIRKLARQAKAALVALLPPGSRVYLRDMRRGKYFRIVARVEIDGEDIGMILCRQGLALPYDGSGGRPWSSVNDPDGDHIPGPRACTAPRR